VFDNCYILGCVCVRVRARVRVRACACVCVWFEIINTKWDFVVTPTYIHRYILAYIHTSVCT
jgi:hypothetical protein